MFSKSVFFSVLFTASLVKAAPDFVDEEPRFHLGMLAQPFFMTTDHQREAFLSYAYPTGKTEPSMDRILWGKPHFMMGEQSKNAFEQRYLFGKYKILFNFLRK